jgi:hypothetical protein
MLADGTSRRIYPDADEEAFDSRLSFQEKSNVVDFHSTR